MLSASITGAIPSALTGWAILAFCPTFGWKLGGPFSRLVIIRLAPFDEFSADIPVKEKPVAGLLVRVNVSNSN